MFRAIFKPQHSTGYIIVIAVGLTALQNGSLWVALLIGIVGSFICGFLESVVIELDSKK